MNPRLIKLKKLLAEAKLDKESNVLYIEDLKLSIKYEESRVINAYEPTTGFTYDD